MSSTQANNNKTKYFLFFAISLLACIAFLWIKPEWCWVTFPFVGTYLALALDVI